MTAGEASGSCLAIAMTMSLWDSIDGGMDNRANDARWRFWEGGGDMGPDPSNPEVGPESALAHAIREEGWRQLRDPPRRSVHAEDPDEDTDAVTISLSLEMWRVVLADAQSQVGVYEELARSSSGSSRREMLASAAGCRETLRVVGSALAGHS